MNSLLLLPYSALLGLDYLIQPQHLSYPNNSFIYEYLWASIGENPLFEGVFSIFMIFIEAVMINRIVIRHRLSRESSLLAGVVFILFMNLLPGVRGVHDVLIANFFALFMLANALPLMRLYKTEKLMFNMGFWTATSILFFPGFIVLIPLSIMALFTLRSIKWVELGQVGLGYINVVLLYSAFLYVMGLNEGYKDLFFQIRLSNFGIIFQMPFLPYGLITLGIILVTVFLAFIYYTLLAKQDFKVHKKIRLIYAFLFFLIFGIIFIPHMGIHHILMLSIPFSILLGIGITHWKQKLLAELFHLILLLGVLYLQFQTVL